MLSHSRSRSFARLFVFSRPVVIVVVIALMTSMATFFGGVASPASAATPGITLTKTSQASVLLGEAMDFSLTASNPEGGEQEYNLSFRDVLPAGVEYTPGSTVPADIGDPTIVTDPETGQQTLTWANVSDLAVKSEGGLSFSAVPDPQMHSVGSVVVNTADAYANTDPRKTPAFDADGVVRPGSYTEEAEATASPTTISAIEVRKSEPSPEHELVRGVHDRSTVYTVDVKNNGVNPTTGVDVVDYLPAGLEFLGCGGADNSTDDGEYPDSGSLAGTPDVGGDCLAPASVDTVQDPSGYPAGVYTKIVWHVGDLDPGDTRTIKYAAGIPLKENTADFGASGKPSAASGEQGANLDNNTGSSTRETGTEKAYSNTAVVTGTYAGPTVSGDQDVEASDALTVTSEDVAVVKTVEPGTFKGGHVATYTLTVRTSEYTDASDIVLTDVLPDGLCPLSDTANYSTENDPECDPGDAFEVTGGSYDGVVQNSDGTFTVKFKPFDLGASGDPIIITYKAMMRSSYLGTNDMHDPTVSGDQFTNKVSLTADTTPIDGTGETGVEHVADESGATIGSDAPTLDKKIAEVKSPYDCATGHYIDTAGADPASITFEKGSRICFTIRADFSHDNSTRDVILTDLLPAGLTFEPGSVVVTPGSVPGQLSAASGSPEWTLGSPGGSDGALYVTPAGFFEATFSALVTDSPVNGTDIDVTGNLAKLRYANSEGQVASLRDKVDLFVSSPPPLAIQKTIADVGGTTVDADSAEIRGGDDVTYRVKVTNNGKAATRNDEPARAVTVWDVLPAGVGCDAASGPLGVVASTGGGTCTDPGDPGHPAFAGNNTLSAISWVLPGPVAPGASAAVTYTVHYTDAVSVSGTLTNTASIVSFTTTTNNTDPGKGTITHHPADNVDTGVTPAQEDAPPATDSASVKAADVKVTKTNTSPVDTNNTAGQAVAGELITYTISARVPAHSSVYRAVLSDALPTGLTFVSASARWSDTDDEDAMAALPSGVVFDPASGTLAFPAAYTNDGADADLFQVTVVARVTSGTILHGTKVTNTAKFASSTAATGGTTVPPRTAGSDSELIAPQPTLTKSDDADGPVVSGQTVRYTLVAGNTAGRPTLYDSVIVDCVPAGLTVAGLVDAPAGAAFVVGGAGCAPDQTTITWPVGAIEGGSTTTIRYDVTVDPSIAGSASYKNTAALTGSTLGDGANDPSKEQVLGASADDTLTAQTATVEKKTTTPDLRPGERGSWTVTVSVPKDVNFFDAAVIDRLPAGIDVTTLTTTSVACVNDDDTACTVPGVAAALDPAGQTIGWPLGDLTSSLHARTVTIAYEADVVTTAGVTRGMELTNTADLRWDTANGDDPTKADASFNHDSDDATAKVTVLEPLLSIAKKVDDARPGPGDTFTYTVTVSNSGADNVSPAYGAKITDKVPAGVVVDPASISDGGVLSPDGRTISWTFAAAIDPGASKDLTYTAKLGASAGLTGGALVNTAGIAHYSSLETGGKGYTGPETTATVTPGFPHVSVAKEVLDGAAAHLNEPKSWRITVTSDGAETAYGVSATDLLPKNWLYVAGSATVVVDGGAAEPAEPGTAISGGIQTLTWGDLGDLGDLPAGATATITLQATPQTVVTADPGVGHGTAQTNIATVAADDATGAPGSGAGPYNGGPGTAEALIDSADLTVAKTHSGEPVAGEPFDWKIAVSNDGPDTAEGPIVITEDLPADVSGGTASGDGWDCSTVATTITCTFAGTLKSGESLPVITVTTPIDSDLADGTDLVNKVSVSGPTHDPKPENNSDTDTATVTSAADLALTKKHVGGDTVTAGAEETYTLDVTNLGPSTSRGPITVKDPLPEGTTFVSADGGAAWDCSSSGGAVTCVRADDLAVGAPAGTIAVVVKVGADRTADVVNTATITGVTTPDPEDGNNSDTVTTPTDRSADLSVDKSSKGSFTPGDDGTYRLTVRNNAGPSTAKGVVVADTLPGYLGFESFDSVDGDWDCTADGQEVTCELTGDLGVDESASVDIVVSVGSDHMGAIVNTATVSGDTPDPNPGNDSDGDDATSDLKSDLSITKSHEGDPVAGESVEYTLGVSNNGPSDVVGTITVTDAIPAGLSYDDSSSAGGTGWDCDVDGALLTCTRDGRLDKGEDAPDITLVLHVDADAGPAVITNIASVSGPVTNTDTDPANNTDEDPTNVVDKANVSIKKTVDGASHVVAGGTVTYLLAAHNDGPSDADDVVVTDAMPEGLTVVSIDAGAGWTCDDDNNVVSCSRDTLKSGADAPVITVVAKVGSGVGRDGAAVSIANVGTVRTATPGDNTPDDIGSVSVDVDERADLELSKSHEGDVVAGRPVTFDIGVVNHGESDAKGPLVVTDTMPAGLTYAGSTGSWTCEAAEPTDAGQEVTCTTMDVDYLVAGATAPALGIIAAVDADRAGTTLTNSAVVSSETPDPHEGNNTDTDDVEPQGLADVSVVKSHDGAAEVGKDLAFSLAVHNEGPSRAVHVVVTDALPAGLAYVSADGEGWDCAQDAGTVTCELAAPLAPGADAEPIHVVATVGAAAYPSVTNAATVATDTTDENPANNTGTDEVPVPALSNLTITKSHAGHLKVGTDGVYTLHVVNEGPTADPGPITVRDQLPAGLTFASATGEGWSCADEGQDVTCVRAGGLGLGEASDITLTVAVGAGAYPQVVNAADVETASGETSTEDNHAEDAADVAPTSELTVTKVAVDATPSAVSWKIVVTNHGPSATTEEVKVSDTLPEGLSFVSASGKGWDCAEADGTVGCELGGPLADGQSASFVIRTGVEAAAGTKIRNTATVTAGDTDGPDPAASATVVSHKPGAAAGGGGGDSHGGNPSHGGGLPRTGGLPLWLLLAGGLLIAIGVGGVWRVRRG